MKGKILFKVFIVLAGLFLLSASFAWAETCKADINGDGRVNKKDKKCFKKAYKDEQHINNCEDPCISGPCPSGLIACGGTCVDPMTDESNCSDCGITCNDEELCDRGSCTQIVCDPCPTGTIFCVDKCIDPMTDVNHCGSCDTVCSGGKVCVSGTCICPSGWVPCGSTCVGPMADESNCGSCGNVCLDGEKCWSGTCGCTPLYEPCTTSSECCFSEVNCCCWSDLTPGAAATCNNRALCIDLAGQECIE